MTNGNGRGAAAQRAAEKQRDMLASLKGTLVKRENAQLFAELAPKTLARALTPERIAKIVLGAASRSPKLLECTSASIVKSVAELVGLGLEPGSLLGEAYLVPYWNKHLGATEAQAIPGYRGYLVLARRSGMIGNVVANIVYEHDRFDPDLAGGERPTHRLPDEKWAPRGEPRFLYSIADFTAGGFHFETMSVDEVELVRQRSKSPDSGPWRTDWGQMARKSIIRRAAHYWSLSTEIASALDLDNRNDGLIFDATSPLQTTSAPQTLESGSTFGFRGNVAARDELTAPAQRDELFEHDAKTGEVVSAQQEPTAEQWQAAQDEAERAAKESSA